MINCKIAKKNFTKFPDVNKACKISFNDQNNYGAMYPTSQPGVYDKSLNADECFDDSATFYL